MSRVTMMSSPPKLQLLQTVVCLLETVRDWARENVSATDVDAAEQIALELVER